MTGAAINPERRNTLNLFENSSPADIHGLDTLRIQELFEGFGYVCKPQCKLRGISGNLHDFDFVCVKVDTGEKIILDSLLNQAGNQDSLEVAMVKLRLKTYDCSPENSYVVTAPLNASLEEMAALYKISLIETTEGSSLYEQLESLLRQRESDSNRKSPLSDLV
jgi:hypothetical protein